MGKHICILKKMSAITNKNIRKETDSLCFLALQGTEIWVHAIRIFVGQEQRLDKVYASFDKECITFTSKLSRSCLREHENMLQWVN